MASSLVLTAPVRLLVHIWSLVDAISPLCTLLLFYNSLFFSPSEPLTSASIYGIEGPLKNDFMRYDMPQIALIFLRYFPELSGQPVTLLTPLSISSLQFYCRPS